MYVIQNLFIYKLKVVSFMSNSHAIVPNDLDVSQNESLLYLRNGSK